MNAMEIMSQDMSQLIELANTNLKSVMQVFNVQGYGAAADGTTDDTAAIQAAIDAAPAGGAIIFFPTGWYKVSSSITISKSAIHLIGVGMGNAVNIKVSSHDFDVFVSTAANFQMENISISADSPGTAGKYGINLSGDRPRVRHIELNGVYNGIATTSPNSVLDDIIIRNIKPTNGKGIVIDGTNEVMYFTNVNMENATGSEPYAGFQILGGASIHITNADLMKMGKAMAIEPTVHSVFSLNCDQIFFDTSKDSGVTLSPSGGAGIVRSKFTNCWFSSCGRGAEIRGNSKGIVFSACEFYANLTDGIRVFSGANVKAMIVDACQIAGNANVGIAIEAGISDFIISNNCLGPTADFAANDWGVYIDVGASDHYQVVNNNIYGNTSGQISDGGSGTHKNVSNLTA